MTDKAASMSSGELINASDADSLYSSAVHITVKKAGGANTAGDKMVQKDSEIVRTFFP
jgi:hypothetical protein